FIPDRAYDILIVSVGHRPLLREKVSLARDLWAAGLNADIQYDKVQNLEEVQEHCRTSGIPHLVVLKDVENELKVRTFENGRMVDRKMTLAELVEMMQPKTSVSKQLSSCDHSDVPKTSSGQAVSYNTRFLSTDRIPINQKRLYERQISTNISPTLEHLSTKMTVEVLATELPGAVVKTIAAYVDMENEETFRLSVSEVTDRHSRYRKNITQVIDMVQELRFEKGCSIIIIYSLGDETFRLLL
ncbi:PREDICTED: eukaryotic translation initiation factor 2-alpha kinase 4-like, partial [Priapulus caudatus]|uniref:Eukaryotic translation initiation factor 2-alpha kinase 4-like n=1 Tax=Priapulus caudatus TaxID=37621 RepID=A0ABM1EIC3_PRICU